MYLKLFNFKNNEYETKTDTYVENLIIFFPEISGPAKTPGEIINKINIIKNVKFSSNFLI